MKIGPKQAFSMSTCARVTCFLRFDTVLCRFLLFDRKTFIPFRRADRRACHSLFYFGWDIVGRVVVGTLHRAGSSVMDVWVGTVVCDGGGLDFAAPHFAAACCAALHTLTRWRHAGISGRLRPLATHTTTYRTP